MKKNEIKIPFLIVLNGRRGSIELKMSYYFEVNTYTSERVPWYFRTNFILENNGCMDQVGFGLARLYFVYRLVLHCVSLSYLIR